MTYCSACGTPQSPGATVCPNCGNPVNVPATQTAPSPVQSAMPPSTSPAPLSGTPMAPMGMVQAAVAPTSTLAIVSLCLGIASYVVIPIVGAIGAIICGHMARKEIRESAGRTKGDGMALAGLILGYAHFVLGCIVGAIILAIIGAAAGSAATSSQ